MGNREQAQQFIDTAIATVKTNPEQIAHGFQLLASAAYEDPTYGDAFYKIGCALSDQNVYPPAIAAWRRALECENNPIAKARILINLGWRLGDLGRLEEGLDYTFEAMRLIPQNAWKQDPQLSYAWVNHSVLAGKLGHTIEAVGAAHKAFEMSPKDPVVEMGLAFALLYDRQWATGLKHFEARFPYRLKNFQHYPYPKWTGERDKTVFLVADQGLGDTLSYARFVEQACRRAKFVHACVQPELLRLFQHAFMRVQNINLMPAPCAFPQADAWSTFVSLPFALGLTDEEIESAPHIDVPVYGLPKTWKVPDRKLHIGIAYEGSAQNDINRHRSIPVEQFLDLYEVPGVALYSLQADARAKDVHDRGCASVIRDLSSYIENVCSTVSLLQDLDLVICIESALGHICGAIGKECWIPYSSLGKDYRAGHDGSKPLWYPHHRFFLQGRDLDWSKVFQRINVALADRMREGRDAVAAE